MDPSDTDVELNARLYLSSDLDDERRQRAERENVAARALEAVGKLLNEADGLLGGLEDDPDILGSALVRACTEMADAIGGLARQLDNQSEEDKRALAKACLEDAAQMEQDMATFENGIDPSGQALMNQQQSEKMSSMSEDDMMLALNGAKDLLRDVEFSLRSIDRNDADEIADVALTLARLFLITLRNFHATITPADLAGTAANNDDVQGRGAPSIEILDSAEEDEIELSPTRSDRKVPKQQPSVQGKDRLRVLWPPLGPSVSSAFEWGKEEASKKPLLAVALGITLWPVAAVTAVVGAPLVLVDGVLQDAYTHFSDGPLVENLERGAAELYQAGRLSFLCGRLVCRQTLRVAKRQVDRHGGVEKLAQDVGGVIVDRLLHPVETSLLCWNGMVWGGGAVMEAVKNFQQMTERHQMETTTTNLH